jgi:hypothetical protein
MKDGPFWTYARFPTPELPTRAKDPRARNQEDTNLILGDHLFRGPGKETQEESVFRELFGRGNNRRRIWEYRTTGGICQVNVNPLMEDRKSLCEDDI